MAEYEELDLAEMQSEYNRVSAENNGGDGEDYLAKFVRLPEKDGFTLMRIMPRKKGGNKHYCVTRVHTLTNPVTGKKKSYHCPKVLVQGPKGPRWEGDCIICDYYNELWRKSNDPKLSANAVEELQNKAREIKPVERYYYNVIVRAEKDSKTGEILKNVGPKIFSCGKQVHAKITRAIVGDESAGESPLGDVTHPVKGRDLRIVKKVVKGGGGREFPNYDNSKFEDVSPAGTAQEVETWLENLHDLQALRVIKSDEELRHALRVHLGKVKEGDETKNSNLAEFMDDSDTESYAPDTKVREELTVSSKKEEKEEEEMMADDEFMKDLIS